MLVRQGCKLQQAGVQPLELAFRQRVEVDATNPLLRAGALQPTKKNLGSTRIRDRALAQTTLDLRITRRLPCTGALRGPRRYAARGTPTVRGVPGPSQRIRVLRRRSTSIRVYNRLAAATDSDLAATARTAPPRSASVSRVFSDRLEPMTSSYTFRRSGPGVATGYGDLLRFARLADRRGSRR